MSTDKGYIRLYRDIRKHWIWNDADALRAWIDLIMLANHEDKKFYFDGRLITVRRGTFITSVRKLAARWGWGKDRTLRFLRTLECDRMIDRKCDTKKTLITIENYGFYQSAKPKSATPTGTQTRTPTGTQTSHNEYTKEDTIKNEGNKPTAVFGDDDTDEAEGWGFE